MASRIVKAPAVQARRTFAAQAAVAQTERELVKAEPLKISTVKVMIAPDRCLNSEVISDPTIYFRVA